MTDPVVGKGLRFVRRNLDELTQTYDLAMAGLLMSRIGEREDRLRTREMAARLICGQMTSGGWTYSWPKVGSIALRNREFRPKQEDHPGDNRPLEGFDRYRESILYTEWTQGNVGGIVSLEPPPTVEPVGN